MYFYCVRLRFRVFAVFEFFVLQYTHIPPGFRSLPFRIRIVFFSSFACNTRIEKSQNTLTHDDFSPSLSLSHFRSSVCTELWYGFSVCESTSCTYRFTCAASKRELCVMHCFIFKYRHYFAFPPFFCQVSYSPRVGHIGRVCVYRTTENILFKSDILCLLYGKPKNACETTAERQKRHEIKAEITCIR